MTETRKPLRRWLRFRRRRATLRTAPGTIKPHPDAPPPQLHVIAFGPDGVEESDLDSPEELQVYLERFPVVWLNVDGLGDAETIKQIGAIFQFHPLALEDVVNVGHRPKIEEYDHHLFVIMQMMSVQEEEPSEQLSLFVGRNYVVTFQERAGQDTFDPIRKRIRSARGRVRAAGADYLAYALLDSVVDGYFPILEVLSDRIDDIESHVAFDTGGQIIREIHTVRNELLHVRRAVWPLRDALSSLVREEHALIAAETRVFLRDCHDHCVQLIDLAEIYRELCSDLRDYLFTIVSQRTNDVMRVLTIIATIFIPLGFIAGVYGMNFDTSQSPWNMPELKWPYGYPFAIGLMLLVAGGLLHFFYRRGWILQDEWERKSQRSEDGDQRSDAGDKKT